MANQPLRIRGQEVTILITRDGNLEDTLVAIQNFTLESQFEVKSQGYLGEKTNRKDMIYNGCKFDFELHLTTEDWFTFQQALKDKAQRNTPNTTINITGILAFANGNTPQFQIPDAQFGPNPLTVPQRGDYVKVKLEGEADDFSVQQT